jgi:hypothetical protein
MGSGGDKRNLRRIFDGEYEEIIFEDLDLN